MRLRLSEVEVRVEVKAKVKVEVDMLLAVDIGNTKISFGIFARNRLIKKFDIATDQYNVRRLKKGLGRLPITGAIVCSVVPGKNPALKKDLTLRIGRSPFFAGEDIRVPIRNQYRTPQQVGQDRLVAAYAASELYGYPAIVIDAGTAITLDVVSRKKAYLGGMILPGLAMSLDALHQRTALLPSVKLSKPGGFIGKDTAGSILSGIVFGFGLLIEGLVKKLRLEFGKSTIAVGTGGSIRFLSRDCRVFDKIDPDLTLKGLSLIYRKIKL